MRSLGPAADAAYHAKIAAETEIYRNFLDVHKLPEIFHYWSNRYLRPKLKAFGFSTPDDMFRQFVEKQFQSGRRARRIASIGAGNCDLEVDLAAYLRKSHSDFAIDCFDLNRAMLDRGRDAAEKAGVGAQVNFVPVDLNAWSAAHQYDAILANQSLHHVLNLENLLAEVKRSLLPGGSFVISDIIGRNGHQRWPEALELVTEFWRQLPPSYRFNQSLLRYEEVYQNWDCSGEGFEGIRAQDILPLLLENFHFELFLPFANLIDPFVDRAFGSNFDANAEWDRNFIDALHERDEKEMASGVLKPTHLLAVLGNDPSVPTQFREPLSPAFCVRDPNRPGPQNGAVDTRPAYDWGTWPHSDREELEFACRKLAEAQARIDEQIALVQERTAWAQLLDRNIAEAAAKIEELDRELVERTAWALQRDRDLEQAARKIEELHQELGRRTAWVERLSKERGALSQLVEERTAWAQQLEQHVSMERASFERLNREWNDLTTAHRVAMERLSWASALDRIFHGPLDLFYRVMRRSLGIFRRPQSGRLS